MIPYNMLMHRNLLTSIATAAILSGCGFLGQDCVDASGDRTKRPLDLGSFNSIHSEGAIDLVLIQTDRPEVVAEGTPVMLDLLEAKVLNDELFLSTKGCWKGDHALVVYLATPALEELTLLGSGSLRSEGVRKEKHLSIELKGSGSISLGIHAERLELQVKGSGRTELNGMVNDLDVEIAGSGDVIALELQATEAEVEIRGSGDADLQVTRRLEATVKGSGNIRYRGTPDVKSTIKGSGAVVPL